jgi:hypothetical protein
VIHLLFVGDGLLDAAVVPNIVATVTGSEVRADARHWARLHGSGKGYRKKLRFAVRQAQANKWQGLVATIDADRDGLNRLRQLRDERVVLREAEQPYPVAIGCADPHLEAWLIDDPVAVRIGLALERDAPVPNVRDCASPKGALEQLHRNSPRNGDSRQDVWGEIAIELERNRCPHATETGFSAFAQDLTDELGPLLE